VHSLLRKNIHAFKMRDKEKKESLVDYVHKNWNIVLNMMVGINKSVRTIQFDYQLPIVVKDYKVRSIF
jgi:hypothetical protein